MVDQPLAGEVGAEPNETCLDHWDHEGFVNWGKGRWRCFPCDDHPHDDYGGYSMWLEGLDD